MATSKLRHKLKTMLIIGGGGILSFGAIGIWNGHEQFYQDILCPILNRVDPELSHRAAVLITKYHLIRSSSEESPKSLATNIGNIQLKNPIGIAAGFDKSAECMSGLSRMGYGAIEIGSVTPLPQEGNPRPRVFRLPEDLAVINRYGFNNDGHTIVHERVQKFKKKYPDQVIGVNLGANKDSPDRIEDYCKGIQIFSDSADYFVVNVSSPNTPALRDLQKAENLSDLIQRVVQTRDKQERRVPIFLKIAPDLNADDVKSICKAINKSKTQRVDGLIISNTTISRDGLKSQLKDEVGGLSGKPLERMSTSLIEAFYKQLDGKIPIIGAGGIWDGQDAYNKIVAGASAVQIYTSITYRGPKLVERIKTELNELLLTNGHSSVRDAIGAKFRKK